MMIQTFELRNNLQTCLTQKMQQAVKLLQMSNQEVNSFVSAFIEGNPLLDFQEEYVDHLPMAKETDVIEEIYGDIYENLWPDECVSRDFMNLPSLEAYDDAYPILQIEPTLREKVRVDASIILPKKYQAIAFALIDLLEEDGYISSSWEEEIGNRGFAKGEIETVLKILQTFEPRGIFARSIEECLLLQLEQRIGKEDEAMRVLSALLSDTGSLKDIGKKLKLERSVCESSLKLLKTLNPKPGLSFSPLNVVFHIPDVIVSKNGDGLWVSELNQETMPKVSFDDAYYAHLKTALRASTDRLYLQKHYAEAKWLLTSLYRRGVNLLKVTNAIVQNQIDFFNCPDSQLKPLALRTIAEQADLSESTVRHIVAQKCVHTPLGIFELNAFFCSSIKREDEQMVYSSKSVQSAIRKIIQGEDHKKPFPDHEILRRLAEMEIHIARRIFAKYREIMNIGTPSERARYYKQRLNDGKILLISP